MLDFFSGLSGRPGRSLSSVLHEAGQTLIQVVSLALLLLGLAGLAIKAFGPEGWAESVFKFIWEAHPGVAIVGIIALLAGSSWIKRALESIPMFGKRGDILVYACLSLGLFFAVKLLFTGTI